MGIRPQQTTELYRKLHARGMTTQRLANEIGCSGGAVRRLISGHRKPAGPIWRRMQQLLTREELALLNATVEQFSTWNMKKPRRPKWTPEIAAALAR